MAEIYTILTKLELSLVVHSKENTIDISAKDINKYTIVSKRLSGRDYIAFGNDQNDIALLSHAKKGYIIGNELKLDQSLPITTISKKDVAESLKNIASINLDTD
ncbi:HAD hydrolase family protein [Lactococcus insecticola]|uniref:Hydrolase n=1 Tax=Pseudolactococcus insecticola TaxID=2709158 RepID=A0A6A0B5I1_9LACT|nr:HAD hydrolase family protein [Lactococcus insecticola]GFH40482.1 hypothetical protein Hs20B_08800 [Lactococcus insecticola]